MEGPGEGDTVAQGEGWRRASGFEWNAPRTPPLRGGRDRTPRPPLPPQVWETNDHTHTYTHTLTLSAAPHPGTRAHGPGTAGDYTT